MYSAATNFIRYYWRIRHESAENLEELRKAIKAEKQRRGKRIAPIGGDR